MQGKVCGVGAGCVCALGAAHPLGEGKGGRVCFGGGSKFIPRVKAVMECGRTSTQTEEGAGWRSERWLQTLARAETIRAIPWFVSLCAGELLFWGVLKGRGGRTYTLRFNDSCAT